ncbi:helix-turn-helix domain-containing protein [Aquimarina sp. 2201CG1-2-11]|uniref:helix-turn-helix domain-containing protein n=1 Tax=Aquimarina discodermiae TaxID=3231043 RepID=UPI0034623C12
MIKTKPLFYDNKEYIYDNTLTINQQLISHKTVNDFYKLHTTLQKNTNENLNISNILHAKTGNMVFIFLIAILISLLYRNYDLRKNHQQKLEDFINTKGTSQKCNIEAEIIVTEILSKKTIRKIEKELTTFILKQEYLQKKISISVLAKKMNTNGKYLSLYINHYEKKKFTDYINELRISYVVEKIKSDQTIRQYTVKAISEIAGFSNPVSFSQAFLKKMGVKPSYFIQKIEQNISS